MRHARSLDFDSLEPRKLLSKIHAAIVHPAVAHRPAAHPAAVVALVPLTINGTLTVDNKGAFTNSDDEGDLTASTPVSGVLGSLGEVRGIWDESTDSMGEYLGPDTIQLHNAKGSFTLVFNNADPTGSSHRTASGSVFYELPQRARGGTGVFAKETETGTIELNTNKGRSIIQSLTLNTTTST